MKCESEMRDKSKVTEFWNQESEPDWLDEAELGWLAEQAQSPELSDPLLFFLPKRREKRMAKR